MDDLGWEHDTEWWLPVGIILFVFLCFFVGVPTTVYILQVMGVL